ncbi:MAG: nucleotidyl transferase AbiEii/AbiGii toxin family protein [Candidatus Sabulitectum sp.]|nr:nucleotidyl transferase AbiEii/AbiGii toxin family protein [Candidatus Sabulitectum sp.]
MIPRAFITAWRANAPWRSNAQVEQDMVISRAIVELFRHRQIADKLFFRGGTALYKLYLTPPARYSEDIDLVQINPEPIGGTIDLIKSVIDPWLGKPKRQFKEGRVNLVYRFYSEDSPPIKLRLKIEINTREHFCVKPPAVTRFQMENPWFNGSASILSYSLDELLGTKLRALYQRKKGRDLFDLHYSLQFGKVDKETVIECFLQYMKEECNTISRAQFEKNLYSKRNDPDFRIDIRPLLRSGIKWDFDEAMDAILNTFVSSIPGEPWQQRKAKSVKKAGEVE